MILNLKSGRKLRTIVELTKFLVDQGVQTTSDLRTWLHAGGNASSLMSVHGVGPKTVSFLKLLVGLDAVAHLAGQIAIRRVSGDEIESSDAGRRRPDSRRDFHALRRHEGGGGAAVSSCPRLDLPVAHAGNWK